MPKTKDPGSAKPSVSDNESPATAPVAPTPAAPAPVPAAPAHARNPSYGKVLLIGDSIASNINRVVIEKALNAKLKTAKAYAAKFDNVGSIAKEAARYPSKNFDRVGR